MSKRYYVALASALSISCAAMPTYAGLVPGVSIPIVDDVVDDARRLGLPVPDVGKAVEDAVIRNIPGAKAASKLVERAGNNVLTTVTTTSGDTIRELYKSAGDVVTEVVRAHENGARTILRGARDIEATYRKAWDENAKQTKKGLEEIADAGKAIVRFESRELQGRLTSAQKSFKQIRDGQVIDGMWTAAVEPARGTENNFFKATQESALINAAAQAAAATYGGPGGAAAYAAWATYKATGDVKMALRAGALAALQSQAGGSVENMPTGTAGEVLKKSAMAGAMGGIAVAAAGGDEKAVKNAFLKSSGNVLIQAGQDGFQHYSPKGANAVATVQCISTRNVDCFSDLSYVNDAKGKVLEGLQTEKLDIQQRVGQWSGLDARSVEGRAAAVVARISKLPESDIIPLMDNQWVMTSTLGHAAQLEADLPTVVVTYVGQDAPFQFGSSYTKIGSSYACKVPNGAERRVVETSGETSCRSTYYRESNPASQSVWASDHNGKICALKTAEFISHLSSLGIPCTRE